MSTTMSTSNIDANSPQPKYEHILDLDGRPGPNGTRIGYEIGLGLTLFVERPLGAWQEDANFEGAVTWASVGRVSLDKAELFAQCILDGVNRARQEVRSRNSELGNQDEARYNLKFKLGNTDRIVSCADNPQTRNAALQGFEVVAKNGWWVWVEDAISGDRIAEHGQPI
jgi:hypothetical protein